MTGGIGWGEFAAVFACCTTVILACRVLPLLLLKGRDLPESARRALGYIPPAAFAALVANDLLSPGMFDAGLWPAAAPLLSAGIVVAVAVKTRSLLWCAVAGTAAFALLSLI